MMELNDNIDSDSHNDNDTKYFLSPPNNLELPGPSKRRERRFHIWSRCLPRQVPRKLIPSYRVSSKAMTCEGWKSIFIHEQNLPF